MCFAEGRLPHNSIKSKNAFLVTVGQLVLHQYGSDKKLVDLCPEVPTLKIVLDERHSVAERNCGMRLNQKSDVGGFVSALSLTTYSTSGKTPKLSVSSSGKWG